MPRPFCSPGSGGLVAVDVLVEASLPRAGVAADAAVGQRCPALEDIGVVVVGVAVFAQVGAGADVALIGPRAVGEAADGADVEVVAPDLARPGGSWPAGPALPPSRRCCRWAPPCPGWTGRRRCRCSCGCGRPGQLSTSPGCRRA